MFKFWDTLDLKAGDVIRINGDEVHSSVHIITRTYRRPYGDKRTFAVDGYTLLCETPYYDDDMNVGEITPLYLEEFLQRSENNTLEVLYRVCADTDKS
tara:strand:- start:4155 stop:4448 length:294 start_codon:yes stop_codon:yes gene_type:complete